MGAHDAQLLLLPRLLCAHALALVAPAVDVTVKPPHPSRRRLLISVVFNPLHCLALPFLPSFLPSHAQTTPKEHH